MVIRRNIPALLMLLVGAGLAIAGGISTGQERILIRGRVQTESGPVAGAVVRVQAEDEFTISDEEGRFEISIPKQEDPVIVTAWIPDHLIGWAEASPAQTDITIIPEPHYTTDNPEYDWFSHEGDPGSLSCSHCMPCYSEWEQDAHSQSAVNPRFLSLYNGTTLTGESGSPTRYRFNAEMAIDVPVAPSQGLSESGPGFRLDYPELGGNCAACHVPGAAARPDGGYHVDLNSVSGVDKEGVFCEFCHKIGAVKLKPETGLPDPSLPGVFSMRLYRPEEGEQVFFGNFDDVNRRVTYLPLIEESAFCAPCHFGAFWGTVVYNSFGEWLESSYSDPENGQTCQDCHMPPVDYDYFVYPEKGGLIRNSERILSHRMPGALDEALLQNTAELAIDGRRNGDQIQVTVRVTNTGAGHHIPTDSPLRNMILLVEAHDSSGAALEQLSGATIPEWGGVGDPETGHYAGLPGRLYAKVLADFYTGEMPLYAYWRQSRLVSDNRIPALATDESRYTFAAVDSAVRVTAAYTCAGRSSN